MKVLNWLKFVNSGEWPTRLRDRLFRGHVSLGPITIYGANAMHWAINVAINKNYWCFHPSTKTFGGNWPWYFYISPDATPDSAVFGIGPGYKDYTR